MSLAPEKQAKPTHILDAIVHRVGQIVLGKEHQIRLALYAHLA